MIPPRESDDAIFEQLCGSQFAAGMHRTVHPVIGHPELVMKVARDGHFANWCEYLVGSSLEEHSPEYKVGRVASISATGKYLMMERLNDLNCSLAGVTIPQWLNDRKPSAFGMDNQGQIKLRDYGMINLGKWLGTEQYIYEEDQVRVPRRVPDGTDASFACQMGQQIGVDGSRAVHDVLGDPGVVMKVCNQSHKESAIEWLVHSQLAAINAEELGHFAAFECSLTGKHVLTTKLRDLDADCSSHALDVPWWLPDEGSALGVDAHGMVKVRRWADARLAKVLMRVPAWRMA